MTRRIAGADPLARIQRGAPDVCWPWTGCTNARGYGLVSFEGKLWLAHRLSLSLIEAIPFEGACALHQCDNPPCCNPAHLYWGTKKDNAVDRETRGRGADQRGPASPGFKDLTGQRFGRLVAREVHLSSGRVRWLCDCDCGRTTLSQTGNLTSGKSTSCGCSRRKPRTTPTTEPDQ